MGYTHYWEFSKNPKDVKDGDKKFKKSVGLLKKCLKDISVKLASGNGEGKPVFTATKVCFNGADDDSYETCYLALDNSNFDFDFCKTARRPYDVAVCLTLLCFKKFFGEDFKYFSDGNMDDEGWAQADKIFTKYTKKK